MSKMAISKSAANVEFWYKGQVTEDAIGDPVFSDAVLVPNFLTDLSTTHVGAATRGLSFLPDIDYDEYFYFHNPEGITADKVYLSGLSESQTRDVTVSTSASTPLADTGWSVLVAEAEMTTPLPRLTDNILRRFSETTANTFSVKVATTATGVPTEAVGKNLLYNPDLELTEDGVETTDISFGFPIFSLARPWIAGSALVTYDLVQYVNSRGYAGASNGEQVLEVHTDSYAEQTITLDPAVVYTFTFGGWVNYSDCTDALLIISDDSGNPANTEGWGIVATGASEYHEVTHTTGAGATEVTFRVQGSVTGTFPSNAVWLDGLSAVMVTGQDYVYEAPSNDLRAAFIGTQIYQPDYNYNYGGSLDNSYKYSTTKTQTSGYRHKLNSSRSDNITIDHESLATMKGLEHLDYQLPNGYCFYERDNLSDDPADYFLANFRHGSRKNDFRDWNSTTITLEEQHEWR